MERHKLSDEELRTIQHDAEINRLQYRETGACFGDAPVLPEVIAELLQRRAREETLVALLRRLEWEGRTDAYYPENCCQICGQTMTDGHAPGCELEAAIK